MNTYIAHIDGNWQDVTEAMVDTYLAAYAYVEEFEVRELCAMSALSEDLGCEVRKA